MSQSVEEVLSGLLAGAVAELDLPTELYAQAVERYEEVGTWLTKTGGDPFQIYPQGSFRLGTVVRPDSGVGFFDIDLVCLREVKKESITQTKLKVSVGDLLGEYLQWKAEEGVGDGPAKCEECRRCWKLDYPRHRFHLDVLPSIPNDEWPPTGILLTDKDLRAWQSSDPIGYAYWFRGRSDQLQRELMFEAKRRGVDVADVPEWYVKSTLQRLVQVLKWHAGVRFANDPDNRPPSILITTLAAQGYAGDTNLFTAVLDSVRAMPSFIERRAGKWWVANPINPDENFADKWHDYPGRRTAFLQWRAELEQMLTTTADMSGAGMHRLVEAMAPSFDRDLLTKAARKLATGTRERADTGRLAISSAGAFVASETPSQYRNTFYGTSA